MPHMLHVLLWHSNHFRCRILHPPCRRDGPLKVYRVTRAGGSDTNTQAQQQQHQQQQQQQQEGRHQPGRDSGIIRRSHFLLCMLHQTDLQLVCIVLHRCRQDQFSLSATHQMLPTIILCHDHKLPRLPYYSHKYIYCTLTRKRFVKYLHSPSPLHIKPSLDPSNDRDTIEKTRSWLLFLSLNTYLSQPHSCQNCKRTCIFTPHVSYSITVLWAFLQKLQCKVNVSVCV